MAASGKHDIATWIDLAHGQPERDRMRLTIDPNSRVEDDERGLHYVPNEFVDAKDRLRAGL